MKLDHYLAWTTVLLTIEVSLKKRLQASGFKWLFKFAEPVLFFTTLKRDIEKIVLFLESWTARVYQTWHPRNIEYWVFFHAEEDRQRQRRRKVDHNQKIDSYRRLVANVRAIGILAFWKSICLVNITKSNNVPSWAAAWHYDDVIEYISLLCRSNHCQNTQLHTPILNFTRQICAQ